MQSPAGHLIHFRCRFAEFSWLKLEIRRERRATARAVIQGSPRTSTERNQKQRYEKLKFSWRFEDFFRSNKKNPKLLFCHLFLEFVNTQTVGD